MNDGGQARVRAKWGRGMAPDREERGMVCDEIGKWNWIG